MRGACAPVVRHQRLPDRLAHATRAELAVTFGVVRRDALRTEAGLPDRRATRRIVDGLRQLLADSPFLEAA